MEGLCEEDSKRGEMIQESVVLTNLSSSFKSPELSASPLFT